MVCDGGVIRGNPSPFGGTWAFVWLKQVSEEEILVLRSSAGSIGYKELSGVEHGWATNNQTELYAMYRGLRGLPDGWDGMIVSDSEEALSRMSGKRIKPYNISVFLWEKFVRAVIKLDKPEWIHVNGHHAEEVKEDMPPEVWGNIRCHNLAKQGGRNWLLSFEWGLQVARGETPDYTRTEPDWQFWYDRMGLDMSQPLWAQREEYERKWSAVLSEAPH